MLLKKCELLCITSNGTNVSYQYQVEQACLGGADIIQFRDNTICDGDFFKIAIDLKKICKKYNALFTVNNRVDIAAAVDADGVHIGQKDLPVEYARKILGDSKIIGLSASSYEQAREALTKNISYIGHGAIFSTQTKQDAVTRGLSVLKDIKKICKDIPVIAIGGIDKTNVADVIKAGADGVAVVRAVCGAENIKKEAEQIKEIIRNIRTNK
jgi:thiamine-phosphate pyrophosphorylase